MGRGGHCSLGDMRDGMRGQAFLGVAHFPGDAPGPPSPPVLEQKPVPSTEVQSKKERKF